MKFIVFNTLSQAKNFLKRNKGKFNFSHKEGCGCCSWSRTTFIKDNRIITRIFGETHGDRTYSSRIIGRIKR